MNKIIPEPQSARSPNSLRPLGRKICLVTGELDGPFFNGGIGTTNRALALVLRELGYDIDILYTRVHHGRPFSARREFVDHVNSYRKLGINVKCIENYRRSDDWLAVSYLSLQHLLYNRYDIAFFDDMDGTAYYPLLARRTGNATLSETIICVTAHSATEWTSEVNQQPLTKFEQLRQIEMERRSIELADAVRAPSAYILKKYRSYGWTLPKNSIVIPNFVAARRPLEQPQRRTAVAEIVFFGRLETRKGLWMFCRALDRLKYNLSGRRVTFLGKPIFENGVSTDELLLRYSAGWPFEIRLLTNFARDQALAYLKKPGCLAVMPSQEDNSPSAIIECIDECIPFIACSGSGGEELLDEDSRKTCLFEPSVEQLCTKLLDAFEHGIVTARTSFNCGQLQRTFAEWLEQLTCKNSRTRHLTIDSSRLSNPILIVVVPPEVPAGQTAVELRRLVQAYGEKIEIELLTKNPTHLKKQLASSLELSRVNISALEDFDKLARALASRDPTVVGICHVTQLLPPAWFARASACFARETSISAITGMVASKTQPYVRESYFSASTGNYQIERYLLGYTPPLFALLEETNGGFLLMRSKCLAECVGSGPLDDQYDRLKCMQDWIHEILVTLYFSGERFELVPDQVLETQVGESQFEVFSIAKFMRSSGRLYGCTPGTDRSILARATIDRGLEQERASAHSKYVRDIAEGIGTEVAQMPLYTKWDAQARQLARIAHASGQIDLATDICADLAIQNESFKPLNLTEYLGLTASGEIVDLLEALAANCEDPDLKLMIVQGTDVRSKYARTGALWALQHLCCHL